MMTLLLLPLLLVAPAVVLLLGMLMAAAAVLVVVVVVVEVLAAVPANPVVAVVLTPTLDLAFMAMAEAREHARARLSARSGSGRLALLALCPPSLSSALSLGARYAGRARSGSL
jgi:hypothetical protein